MQRDGWKSGTRTRTALVLAAMVLACGSALAANGTLTVSLRVLAPRPAFDVLDGFPAPPGSVRVTRTRQADSYLCPLDSDAAARALRDAMPQRGFTLAYASPDGMTQHWHDARARIEVQLDPVLGQSPATRIVVQADVRA
jgi:hypothetical protein